MREVFITSLSKYLPYSPVSNDEMESKLGYIDGRPSKVRALILRNNGIKTRHYAFAEGEKTLSNAHMTAEAVRGLFQQDNSINNLDLLACGTTSPDQNLPSHAAMVHGELQLQPLAIYSYAGACNTGMQALKTAFVNIAIGDVDLAVATGSERMSKYMTADKFKSEIDKVKEIEENGYIAFEKDFLRWMLSDGAGAARLENQPNAEGISLRIEWIDQSSFAGQIPTCMYAGAVMENEKIVGYNDVSVDEWLEKGVFAIKQDTKLLGSNIVARGMDFLIKVLDKRNLDLSTIDWFLPHLSSEFFRPKIKKALEEIQQDIPYEKWYTNLSRLGNVGAASPYFMLEEMFNQNMLKKGQRIFIMVPESARFSYSYALLTVV